MEKGQQLAVHGWSNDIEDNNSTITEQKTDKKIRILHLMSNLIKKLY